MTHPTTYTAPAGLLRERVILVTGASRGIGRAAALAFAAHGATVVLLGRDTTALEQAYDAIEAAGGPEPAAIPFDLAAAGTRQFDELAHAIESKLGRLDGILHNASHFEKLSPLEQQSIDEWMRTLRVNVVAAAALGQACARLLKRAPDASVVFTLETHGRAPAAYWGSYGVSKAALEALMRTQAAEWSGHPNLRANAIVPGPVDSPLRSRTHPGALASALRDPAPLMPAYLYLMGPDSRGVTGTIVECA
jgi:NAD(P)-dependent dehydrogenase (short-subunit alcohol dehydrogenase family)